MTDKLIDTNILVYAYDTSEGIKHEKSKNLLKQIWEAGGGIVCVQNLMEFFVVITQIVLLSLSFIPFASADGFIHIYYEDRWNLFNEDQQLCAINYKDGFQNMILIVDPGQELTGEKAVWIFPIPVKPNRIAINIVKDFPQFLGYDVQDKADESISNVFMAMRATQIYTFPVLSLTMLKMEGARKGVEGMLEEVTIYKHIEKMGLTTELVSAVDGSSLTNYVISKGLNLPESSRSILDEYIGREYSFVISWISNIEKFKQEQGTVKQGYGEKWEMWTSNSIGVFITFPTDKIYYPLKPTSVYGSTRVAAVIYVLDYVEPELYDGVKTNAEVNYFFENQLSAPEGLRDFFAEYEKKPSTYYTGKAQEQGFTVKDVKYTRIKINPPSKYLTQDLWMKVSAPFKIKAADFASRYGLLYGLIFFILCSCLASLLSGMIIFRNKTISKLKFTLFGLWNFLTLIGFSIAAYITKIDIKSTQSQEIQKSDISFGKIITRSLLIALVITVLFLFL
ncbi:MAG: hypothetical protein AB1414_20600, partial [bacterium]